MMTSKNALAVLRKEPHTSISAVQTYLTCPRKFRFHYIEKEEPTHRPVPLAFGIAVHGALASFFNALKEGRKLPSAEELQETFRDSWRFELDGPLPVLFSDKKGSDYHEKLGLKLMSTYLDQAPRHKVIEVEMAFSLEVVDWKTGEVLPLRLVGALDAVVEDPKAESGHRIIEVKTAARKWSDQRLRDDLQLTAYHWAGSQLGLGTDPIALHTLRKTREPGLEIKKVSRSDRDHQEFLSVVIGVHRAINASAFYKVRSWACASCPYAAKCVAG